MGPQFPSRKAERANTSARRQTGRATIVVSAAVALLIGFGFGYVAGRGSDTSVPHAVNDNGAEATTRLRLDYELATR
jgi:hypothetical protein